MIAITTLIFRTAAAIIHINRFGGGGERERESEGRRERVECWRNGLDSAQASNFPTLIRACTWRDQNVIQANEYSVTSTKAHFYVSDIETLFRRKHRRESFTSSWNSASLETVVSFACSCLIDIWCIRVKKWDWRTLIIPTAFENRHRPAIVYHRCLLLCLRFQADVVPGRMRTTDDM